MSFRIKVAPRAAIQIRAAAEWWAEHRSKAPLAFAEDLESAYALIQEFPFAGEPVRHRRIANVRRILMGRVRYQLYYVFSGEESVVEILALWHASRGTHPRLASE